MITFLEDRRVLYSPGEMEVPDHCVHSVIEIRHYLTSELQKVDDGLEIAKALTAMRAACRKFMDTVQGDRGHIIRSGMLYGSSGWIFNSALGEMRGVFGVHLLQLAVEYGVDEDARRRAYN